MRRERSEVTILPHARRSEEKLIPAMTGVDQTEELVHGEQRSEVV
jgi:hypothetical protein